MTSFSLNEKQGELKELARKFASDEIAPKAEEIDEKGVFPEELFRKLGQAGFCGIFLPREFGGAGLDYVAYVSALEEVAKASVSVAAAFLPHTVIERSIYAYGSPEQKRKYLEPLAKGQMVGAIGLTERTAGSDFMGIETRAEKKSGGFVLNGGKCFITNAGVADLYIIWAKTSEGRRASSISAFLVEKGTKGFRVGRLERKMAIWASPTGELFFEDCFIPQVNLVGAEGQGFKMAMEGMDYARVGGAVVSVGLAQAALENAMDYAKSRDQFEQKIASFQAIQFMISDMAVMIEAARLLALKAASLLDQNRRATYNSSAAKVFATDMAVKVAIDAVQVFGGYGYMKDYPVERYLREAKIGQIWEGTNQIQRLVIARELLGRG